MMEEKCSPEKKYKHDDQEFNPVLINVYDDERTLDEEEALEPTEDPQTELQNLQREGDMPLEELLKLCGYADPNNSNSSESECEYASDSKVLAKKKQPVSSGLSKKKEDQKNVEVAIKEEEVEEEEEDNEDDMEDEKPERSALCQLYDDILPDTTSTSSRPTRSVLRPQSEEEDEDNDYSPDEEELKKTIMVGSNYQAYIPEGLCKYDDALPYENEDKLLWDPCLLTSEQIEKYLIKAQEVLVSCVQGVSAIPMGAHTRDDEQALYLLLQCDYNMDEALRRMKMNVSGPTDAMSLWSEEECRNFETGLRTYGKNFHLIQLNKVRTRSVGELVQFYYLWKKTERHDVFANKARLEKKKYTLHPGITDYMDRFLEDQDSAGGNESGVAIGGTHRDRSSSPNIQCLIFGDHKRQNRSATTSPSSHIGKDSNPASEISDKHEIVKTETVKNSSQVSNVKPSENPSLINASESSSSV